MRLLIISYERLISNGSAGTAVMCGLVDAALRRNFEVTYVALCTSLTPQGWEQPFDFGSNVHNLRQALLLYRRELHGPWRRFIGSFNHAAVSKFTHLNECAELQEVYDCVIAFDSLAISLSRRVSAAKKISILGDPAGRRIWHTSPWSKPVMKLKAFLVEVAELAFFALTPRRDVLAMFGSGHSKFWSHVLARKILDLRPFLTSPIVDLHAQRGDLPIINFGGTLAGTASRQSITSIFDAILPALRSRLGSGMFELRFVGDSTEYFQRLSKPHCEIKLLGRVASFEVELAAGDIFILPMNYPVGVRTRVCSALAAGNICLVHPSVLFNMPELEQCEAVKVVASAVDYAAAIADLPMGAGMVRLRKIARQFFDSHYSSQTAAAPLLNII